MSTVLNELRIPDGVFESDKADEFVRFWVAGGEDHVSLHIGAMGEHEVRQWGMILADLSVHIIRGLRQDGSRSTEEELRAEMERAYLRRLTDKDVDISGSLLGFKQ